MRIFGALLVRDAVDLVRVNVLHHLSLGLERILAVDNGSSDGTDVVLERLARRVALDWRSEPGPYDQSGLMTGMLHAAAHAGVDWVLPLDADEFYVAPEGLATVLADATAPAILVRRINFVQRRSRHKSSTRSLLTMDARAATTTPADEGPAIPPGRAFVELEGAPKAVCRASDRYVWPRGNHAVLGLEAPAAPTDRISVLHAPLRSREALANRRKHSLRLDQAGASAAEGWHVRRWSAIDGEDALTREWAANSNRNGFLDVDGTRRPLVQDERLQVVAARWVRSPLTQAAARLLRRSF